MRVCVGVVCFVCASAIALRCVFARALKGSQTQPCCFGRVLKRTKTGTRTHAKDPVLGPYGIERVNSAGRSLCDHLNAKGMCSAASFFSKLIHCSWRHPRSKKLHQLDHLLIPRDDLCRVRDACIWNKLTVESDHAPLQMKLRIARNLSKQTESKGKFINRELLRNPTSLEALESTCLCFHFLHASNPAP